jgi:hypothetical protein
MDRIYHTPTLQKVMQVAVNPTAQSLKFAENPPCPALAPVRPAAHMGSEGTVRYRTVPYGGERWHTPYLYERSGTLGGIKPLSPVRTAYCVLCAM